MRVGEGTAGREEQNDWTFCDVGIIADDETGSQRGSEAIVLPKNKIIINIYKKKGYLSTLYIYII